MQIGFSLGRERAVIGQKYDTVPATVVSMTCKEEEVFFGALLVTDPQDKFLCKPPRSEEELVKPLGIALRQLHTEKYGPGNQIAILKQGRVWVEAEKVASPGDGVFIKFDKGQAKFTGKSEKAFPLKGAIFLEPTTELAKIPIEIDFVGGAR